ncbi:MAG: phosphoadenosine phosphosulfate reductase [Paracoccaceae bacterium]
MQNVTSTSEQPLAGLNQTEWMSKFSEITGDYGTFRTLNDNHVSAYLEGDETLLVTFETVQGIRALSEAAQPLGWELTKSLGWSNLCIASDGDTWFRDQVVWSYIDELIDEGFFDEFEQIIFYGAGPCGYAAATYSVAAPGSTVVVVQPQATLDPRVTEWDDRFFENRRLDFTSRYGFAPEMIDAAERVFVLYDPNEKLDAMHAALFHKPHVRGLRLRHLGNTVQSDLMEMKILNRILIQAESGKLSTGSFAKLYRARREHPPYLRRLLTALDTDGRDGLALRLARHVTQKMKAPRFQRRLAELNAKLGKDDEAH